MRSSFAYPFSLLFLATAAALSSPAHASGAEVIQCRGNDMTISHDDADIHFVGACGVIRIVGDDATVTIDAADGIVIEGDDATVRSADDLESLTIEGNDADVDVADIDTLYIDGNGNTVAADAVENLHITGNDNRVTWIGTQPTTEITGQRNTAQHH